MQALWAVQTLAVTERLSRTDMGANKKLKSAALVLAVAMLMGCFGACGGKNDDGPDEQYDYTDLSVRDFIGQKGIIAAASPYAAKAGLDILKSGGNAFDAAVATSFALGVAEPSASGLGGGGMMIAYNVKTQKSLFYNFREFAPAAADTNLANYKKPMTGENCCIETAVPTQVAGLLTILEEQGSGKISKSQILAPAIELAENGISVTSELSKNISESTAKIMLNGSEVWNVFSDGIEGLYEGDTLVQKDLANTLRYVSEHTKEQFYTGEIAQKIVDASRSHGGSISMEDMRYAYENYPVKSEALTGTYKGFGILTASSPSTGGTMLVEMLNMLECYGNASGLGHNSAEYINLISTVMQLAYGDKEKYMADSAFSDVPLTGLTSKEYARKRLQKYTAGKAYTGTAEGDVPYGDPYEYNGAAGKIYSYGESGEHESTTTFSVIDEEGNIVTFTQTINNFFGCGIVPDGTGFFLNNETRDFSYEEGSINVVEPLKQPASYMMPTVLLKDGKPYATLGSPGGSRIPSAVLQVVLNMTEFGMDIQEAISAPRVYCFTTVNEAPGTPKSLYIENSLKSLLPSLNSFGYNAVAYSDWEIDSYFGGVQGIKVEGDKYHGGADPRRDGKALGY